LTILGARHIFTLHDPTNLGFETHIKHTISLIKDEVTDISKTNPSTFDEIDESAWSSAEKVTPTLDLAELLVDICAPVHDGWADPGTIRKFTSFIVDLGYQLTSWG